MQQRRTGMPESMVQVRSSCRGFIIPIKEKGRVTDMCKAWEDQKKEGRQEGMEKGIELTKQVIRLNAQGHTLEEIARETKIPEEKGQFILE